MIRQLNTIENKKQALNVQFFEPYCFSERF